MTAQVRRVPQATAGGTPRGRRAAWAGGTAAGAVLLFLAYLHVSRRVPAGSDGGSIALQAWDMLHGNLLLHGWTVSDVPFWPTELPQYALIEAVRGLVPDVVHVAGAMTYTLVLLLAAWLARGRATGRDGAARLLIVAVVMLAPAPAMGPTLLMSPDHFGSAVPVLATWLAVDGWPGRWYLPPAVAVLLTWGQLADGLILVTGAAPLVIAAGARAGVKLCRRQRPWPELWLAAAAIASAGLARAAAALLRHAGGYGVQPVATTFAGLAALPHHLALTAQGLLALFGASFTGPLSGPDLAVAVFHLVGVATVAAAFVIALGRLGRGGDLAVPGLAVAIVLNVAAYLPSVFVQDLRSTREISAALPFAAVLAGRLLAGPITRARLLPALAVAGAACAVALGYYAAQPPQPAQNGPLAAWLAGRHLSGGLSLDYGIANSTTLDSGGRITVRQIGLRNGALTRPVPRELKASWYDPARNRANFLVVSDAKPGDWGAERAAAVRTFGPPAQVLQPPGYTVLVWHENLLAATR